MADTPVSLDKWRDYFSGANSDIFDVIEHAIMVAASDCPFDFKVKRDRIAEMLFSCRMTKCFGCNRFELSVPSDDCLKKDDDDRCKSDEDAEALSDETEEESRFLEEVLSIKEIVENFEEESDDKLFKSLRRLQLMPLSVEILKATELGKSVNALRKHGSKKIRNLVRTLIEDWKLMVDEWVNAATAITEGAEVTTESGKTSGFEKEEGLPSPPLDEGALLATPTSMELSQFFDGMDDDGNLRNSGEFNKNRENGRMRKFESPSDSRTPPKVRKEAGNKRNQESTSNKEAPLSKPVGLGQPKPPKPAVQPNLNSAIKRQMNSPIHEKKPIPHQREKLNCDNEASDQARLEAAKRKLQERYQEAENAKKQRTIQVVDLHDLPKQDLAHRIPQMRPGHHHRRWGQR